MFKDNDFIKIHKSNNVQNKLDCLLSIFDGIEIEKVYFLLSTLTGVMFYSFYKMGMPKEEINEKINEVTESAKKALESYMEQDAET